MKALVVVDMQNDFIDGALGTKEAEAIVGKVVDKIKTFDGEVIATRDTHDEDYLDTQEGKNLPVVHCVKPSHGWLIRDDVYDAIVSHDVSLILEKPTFGSVDLCEYLYGLDDAASFGDTLDEIVIVGLCTDICVISNAMMLKAFLPEVKITVDAACCAGVTPESHENALRAMKMCQINIENWEG